MAEVAVLGGGSWGTALAHHAATCGHGARLVFRDAALARRVQQERCNGTYLPGLRLHDRVRATVDAGAALAGADLVLVVTPVRGLEQAASWLAEADPDPAPVVSCAKGIREGSLETPLQVLARLRPGLRGRLVALSGPSFAVELMRGDPTAAVVAAAELDRAGQAQQILSGGSLRLYTNNDPTGVELAGALKNVIALAAGVVEGLGLGSNTTAALITRGLAELSRLGLKRGGAPATFAGLAGLGDLVLTCTGALSRNRAVGRALGQGHRLADILSGMKMVAEGVPTTGAALALARREAVEMPIVEQVHAILFEGRPPRKALDELLSRALREEDGAGADRGG